MIKNFIIKNILKNYVLYGLVIGIILQKVVKAYNYQFYEDYLYYLPVFLATIGWIIHRKVNKPSKKSSIG